MLSNKLRNECLAAGLVCTESCYNSTAGHNPLPTSAPNGNILKSASVIEVKRQAGFAQLPSRADW